MIIYEVATKVRDTEAFPQHNIVGLISGITSIVLFQSGEASTVEGNKHTHTQTHTHTHTHTNTHTHTEHSSNSNIKTVYNSIEPFLWNPSDFSSDVVLSCLWIVFTNSVFQVPPQKIVGRVEILGIGWPVVILTQNESVP